MSLVTALTYVLPHRLLSSMARALAYSDNPRLKQWLIDTVTRRFGVNLAEAAQSDPTKYPTFNAFFTRALKPGARVADADPRSLLMPADGHVSQCGPIENGRIFQAKGQSFTAAELLGDEADATPFNDGLFATVYLSPRDYHRVHMPGADACAKPCMSRAACSAWARRRWRTCRACSRETNAWSATSTPTSVRWRW